MRYWLEACRKETIKMIRLGETGCASHTDAAKLLNLKEHGGRSETIIASYFRLPLYVETYRTTQKSAWLRN